MNRITLRCSRRHRICEGCRQPIASGEYYLSHVCSPNHDDLGNAGWWRIAECRPCAQRVGRGELFEDFG